MEVLENTVTQAFELFAKKEFETALDVLNNSSEDLENELQNIDEDQRDEYLASVQNLRGFICLGTGDNKSAQSCFERGLQLNPHSSQACAGLGEVLFLQNQDEEAKIMFEWALDLNSDNEFARNGLTKVNNSLGLHSHHNSLVDDSISEEESAIFNQCVTDAYKLFRNKDYQNSLDKVVKAEELLTTGIMSNSTLLKISSLENFKGFNYLALEQFDEAQACFEKALNLDSRSSQACAGLGELFYLKGMDTESKTMFEYSITYDSRNDFALNGLAKINRVLGLEVNHNSLEEKKVS
ncbi:MAG: hypothetical protein QY331_02880 [Melioribacteraceae bacterium]|nr:MAG: hypothetical protein QY331_02880 [Melioribacteraceae bacterium]